MRAIIGMAAAAVLIAAQAGVAHAGTPPPWRKLTSFFVLPSAPHQNDVVRVLLHCPDEANHAIVGSTAFMLKGSWRTYREVGLGLSERGFARDGVIISRYAPPGHHEVRMKCVKVTIDQHTHLRKVKVLSRASVPLFVREFRVRQYF
ncbi:hypothetical protein HCN51_33365 [Nonomuraea sp. FMUSA5-5]|uniref:Uncharacterized protein n=1 Tax=Nonomuraea composti TaxID=2720023 RepID=A0ABX1BD01_9ACTN|nr:hypothetical protein [Nonomuraea sp. FMUSA5-5]NJP94272.1 hypothetical protein [Nonomuraea sp. FMUSA5-5]